LLTGWLGVAHAASPPLETLRQRIVSGELPGVHSVLVIQHGNTVAEWYFSGDDATIGRPLGTVTFTAETLHDIRSVTKSVVSLLFGIAQSDGLLTHLDTPVLGYFPEYPELRTPERLRITLGNILSMTSGLHWDGCGDRAGGRRADRRVCAAPTLRAARHHIRVVEESRRRAASGLRLRPRDIAKLGRLMLQDGKWGEQQIVPAAWVRSATSHHAQVEPDPACGIGYGYRWWLGPGCETQPPTPWFAGIGNGGQRLWVVPSWDLVVVSTAGLYDDPRQRQVPSELFASVLRALAPTIERWRSGAMTSIRSSARSPVAARFPRPAAIPRAVPSSANTAASPDRSARRAPVARSTACRHPATPSVCRW
jgi:CubicO group peptidase (beta-lactamase class C family)